MRTSQRRHAFTMIELLIVIVILGIVGGIALESIRNFYEGIFRMGEYQKRVSEADHILEKMSKYFEYAVGSSIVNLDRNVTVGCYGPPNGDVDDSFSIAFVGADRDTFFGLNGRPGWSEETYLIDNNISAFDANYTAANTIITGVQNSTLLNSAIYNDYTKDVNACNRFNWDGGLGYTAGYHKINANTSTMLELNASNIAYDGKRKYLLRSGYAFRVNDGNLTMYYNFRPWMNENYKDGNQSLLAQNVAHIYIDYDASDFVENDNLNDRGLVWRLKVCMFGVGNDLSLSEEQSNNICRERRVRVRF